MEKIRVEDAVGKVLGADVTEVIPGVGKGPLFKRGHIIRKEDIEKFLSIGKHHIWIFGESEGVIHEDDAAIELMNSIKGEYLSTGKPSESKVKLFAERDGILVLQEEALKKINLLPDSRIATKYNLDFVKKGDVVAIGKVMPVEIPVAELSEIKKIANSFSPVINLLPIQKNRIAIFPVGNEFLEGRKEEVMSLRIKAFLEDMVQEVFLRKILPDDSAEIQSAGQGAIDAGADILIYMGGLAVDPDDKTVEGMVNMELDSYIYGIPMWPGITFFIGYKGGKIVLGIPSSAGLMSKGTSFHRLVPIFLARYRISKEEITKMAIGGLLNAGNL